MEQAKKLLNIAIAISILLLSSSVFIYSIKDSKAAAAPAPQMDSEGYVVAGISSNVNNDKVIIGYNPTTKDAKVMCKIRWR